ncbi:MAG: ferritin-like domain-containing protein [Acidobacteria bacterium]|nr:ferritin-like domain-containing protein [Acidobacteriota bacterium]
MVTVLRDVCRDKLALMRRHERAAQMVSSYDFNNTYQQVIGREETHLCWLRAALSDAGEPFDADVTVPDVPVPAKGEAGARVLFEADVAAERDFVARWRPRVLAITHARHRKMLDLMLGEAVEHQRFFELAATGRNDLLGRRPDTTGTGGGVLSTRWIG